jgi:hypothetical protein
MHASYRSIDEWLQRTAAAGTTTVQTADLACVLGLDKVALVGLAKRGAFGPYVRDAGRFYRVQVSGVRGFVERYRCAFMNWVSLAEACRLTGARSSTLVLWLDSGVIAGGRDMYGRVQIDPASLSVAKEHLRWTRLPDEVVLQGGTYYSLAHLARELTMRAGIKPDDASFDRRFRQNYTMFYRWLTQTALHREVRRVGRRHGLYIPAQVYEKLVDVVRPKDAALMIGATPHMLQYWARKGHIGFVRFAGTQKMVPREELNAFLEYRREVQKKAVQPRSTPRRAGRADGGSRSGGKAEPDLACLAAGRQDGGPPAVVPELVGA